MDSRLIYKIKTELKSEVEFLELVNSSVIEEYANYVLKNRSEE
jgi:hypothetical protein